MADKIVMGYWDCPFCQTKKIKGTLQDCPNCGATRTKDVRFYMDQDITYLSEEDAKSKGKGADWMCTWCRSFNSASAVKCKNCGAERDDKSYDYFERQEQKEKNHAASMTSGGGTKEQANIRSERKAFNIGKLILSMLFLIAIITGIVSLFLPKTKNLTVSAVSWRYNIEIEKYREVEESDWYLPADGTLIRTARKIHHYDEVLDYYERVAKTRDVIDGYDESTSYSDNGDGTFTEHTTRTPRYKTETYYEEEPVYRDVPVYQTKYYYTIWRWMHERDVTTTANDKNPFYGDVVLGENEREGRRSEEYNVTGFTKRKGKEKTYDVPAEIWNEVFPDHTYKVKIQGSKILELK